MSLQPIEGGVCAPVGFKACGVAAGLKKERLDLALVASDVTASAAGCFTTNAACAAPVALCKRHLIQSQGRARAVLLNAGCANACTGEDGLRRAERSARELAPLLKATPEEILVASTGVIGVPLQVEKILAALSEAVSSLSREGASLACRAIMTTDTRPKERSYELTGDLRCRMGGMAKGAGMIAPNMATMLSVLTTDAMASSACLQELLLKAVGDSFNAVTVDGDTSTNDSVFLLANGLSGSPMLDDRSDLREAFQEGLILLCQDLAKMIARDGEGATKMIEIRVINALTLPEARQIAKTVAESPLVKTAVYGGDPNWGRIVAAAGRTGVPLDPSKIRIFVSGDLWLDQGYQERLCEQEAHERLIGPDVLLTIDLDRGSSNGVIWTCDLTEQYIDINAHYRT